MSAGLRTAQVIDLEELNQWLAQLEDEDQGGFVAADGVGYRWGWRGSGGARFPQSGSESRRSFSAGETA